jgi:hypothetical protein
MLTSSYNLKEVRPGETDCGPINSEAFIAQNDGTDHKEDRSL